MKSNNINITDFKELVGEGKLVVDKTLLIKEFLENENRVTLITRPKRFGKTLNMSMLKYFLDIREKGRVDDLFKSFKIWKEKEIKKHLNAYPVVHIDLSDVTENHIGLLVQKVNLVMSDLYKEHADILKEALSERELKEYEEQENQKASQGKLEESLNRLVYYLHRHYGKEVILLIDGYDTAINKMYVNLNIEEQCLEFFAKFYGSTLKNNVVIKKCLMMGLLPMAKTAMAEMLGNINVASITSNDYAKHFGFSKEEIVLTIQRGCLSMGKVKKWYGGYQIGKEILYNPWSIVSYQKKENLEVYERSINDIDFAYKAMRYCGPVITSTIQLMMLEKWIKLDIKEEIDLRINLKDMDEPNTWSMLFHLGYLTYTEIDKMKYFELVNKEIRTLMDEKVKRIYMEIYKIRV